MERLFIMVVTTCLSCLSYGQNLVMNPDFEQIVPHRGDLSIYVDSFYAKNWLTPTGCSVDIYRNKDSLNIPNFNLQAHKPFETKVVSGSYCIGMFFLDFMGHMEHITGRLIKPLVEGQKYEVSFYLRMHKSLTPFIPKGIGYKFSRDSIIFEANEFDDNGKISPLYDHIFQDNKVYADYEIDQYLLDTLWVKHKSVYTASGGEKYITFGRFAYKDDEKIIKKFKKLRYNPWKDKIEKFVKSDRSLVCKRFFDRKETYDFEGSNYYYVDQIEVVPLNMIGDSILEDIGSDLEIINNKEITKPGYNYIDLDPVTSIPSEREIIIDKGFVGDFKIELGIRLKPMEKCVLQFDKKCEIIIINTEDVEEYSEMKYVFKHPAKRLRKRPVRFYIEETSKEEIEKIKSSGKSIEIIDEPNFKGIMIKRKK